MSDQKLAVREQRNAKKTWAEALINAAHMATYSDEHKERHIQNPFYRIH